MVLTLNLGHTCTEPSLVLTSCITGISLEVTICLITPESDFRKKKRLILNKGHFAFWVGVMNVERRQITKYHCADAVKYQ